MRLLFILAAAFSVSATWPIDSEPYGFLGCKQLQYRGYWECNKDTVNPEESVEGICIAIAVANIMMYYRWPSFSHFDGMYMTSSYDGMIKHIDQHWNYRLITGDRTTADCETDDPETRHLPGNPEWTGLQELRRLLYAVERSFGFNHNYFKTKDSTACKGDGYFGIEHVLRNRFGYPNCRTIDAKTPEGRKIAIDNLKRHAPVIAMRCDHIYLLDGYGYDPVKKREIIHSSDYLQAETSIGWFPWKAFYMEKLDRFVVDLDPGYHLPKGPSRRTISYFWGDGFIPGMKYTERKGQIFIYRENNQPLGSLELTLQSVDLSTYAGDSIITHYKTKGVFKNRQITIPETGYFNFDISEARKIELTITNRDPFNKNIRVLFCDVSREKS